MIKDMANIKNSASRKSGLPKKILKYVIIIFLLVCLVLVFNYISKTFLAQITNRFSSDNGSDVADTADNSYMDLSESDRYKDYSIVYTLTADEMTSIISDMAIPKHFNVKSETVNYSLSTPLITTSLIAYDNGNFSLNRYQSGILTESIKCNQNEITFTDELKNRSNSYPVSENFTFEQTCSIPSLAYLSEICTEVLNTDTPTVDYDITLVTGEKESLYKIVFIYPDINQKEEYYVSAESNMIVANYTYLGDDIYYRYLVSELEIFD